MGIIKGRQRSACSLLLLQQQQSPVPLRMIGKDFMGFRSKAALIRPQDRSTGRHPKMCCGRPPFPDGSQNVLWKTAIPGRGHSSPILSGNAVYLTTTYRSSRRFPIQVIWNHAIFVLTLLLTITGITFAVQELTFKQSKVKGVYRHIRFFLFIHSWLIATMLVICCLVLSLLFVPLRSRRQLAASLASVIFTVPAFLALKHRGLVLSVGSLEGIAIAVVLISPLVFGLALLTAHLLSRKRSPVAVQSRDDPEPAAPVLWHYLITGTIGFIAALLPFFALLYRSARHLILDSLISYDRIKPDVGWWCIGLYTALVFITITRCFLKSNRRPATAAAPLRAVVPVIALTLGAAFFVYVNFVEKPGSTPRTIRRKRQNSNTRIANTCHRRRTHICLFRRRRPCLSQYGGRAPVERNRAYVSRKIWRGDLSRRKGQRLNRRR